METLAKIPYKGYNINVYQDNDTESPDNFGDESVFLVAFHRDFTVDRKGFDRDTCVEFSENGSKEYHVFGLEAYIHSGVSLALSQEGKFPDRQWDVSQLGLVFVSKKETRYKTKAGKIAQNLIELWNDYLSGNVYGYMVEKDDNEFGGVWGFYGDYETSGLIDNAKVDIDREIKNRVKKHTQKLKAMIINHVPLEKRTTCNA